MVRYVTNIGHNKRTIFAKNGQKKWYTFFAKMKSGTWNKASNYKGFRFINDVYHFLFQKWYTFFVKNVCFVLFE